MKPVLSDLCFARECKQGEISLNGGGVAIKGVFIDITSMSEAQFNVRMKLIATSKTPAVVKVSMESIIKLTLFDYYEN